jgi:pimeloyl-ACP methyl ester carboxylesterase
MPAIPAKPRIADMLTRREVLTAGATLFAAGLPAAPLFADRVRSCQGRRIAYREYGDPRGQLVFYFHGTPGSRLEAALVAEDAHAAGIRLISVDRPGLGCSTHYECRRVLDWPGDVLRLAGSLGYADAPFGILGMSGGAPYAAACALKFPQRLTHVAIVSGHAPMCAPGVCPGNQDKLIELIARRQRLGSAAFKLIDRKLDRKPDKVVSMITKKWTAADKKLVLCNPRRYRQLVANLNEAGRCGPAGIVTDIRLLACHWGFSLCQVQGVSVSIWQGGCDRIVTPSMGRYFHRQIADSELIQDPRAGHVTMLKWHSREIFSRFGAESALPTTS